MITGRAKSYTIGSAKVLTLDDARRKARKIRVVVDDGYGFIVMIQPGGLGVEGRGKAPHWRLTKKWYVGKPPTRDFLNGMNVSAKTLA